MKKRILALSLAAAMVIGALASCTKTAEPASSTSVEARDISLVLWGPEQDQEFLKTVAKEWGDKYAADNEDVKSVTVDVQIKGEDNAKTDALNDIQAAADVFGVPSDATADLVNANAIYELPSVVADEVKSVIGDNAVYQSTIWEGKNYGLPYTPNTAAVLFYNTSKLTADDVKSLNTIVEKAKLGIESSGGWHDMMWFASSGAELYTNHDKTVNTLNNADDAKLLTWLAGQLAAGTIARTDSADNLGAWLEDGQVDAGIMGSWKASDYKEKLGDNYGVAELPSITVEGSGINNAHMRCFGGSKMNVINANSKEPEAALSLAQAIMSQDNQVKRFEMAGKTPASTALLSNPTIAADPLVTAEVAQTNYVLNASPLVGQSGYWSEMPAIINDIVDKKLTDEAAIQERLDAAVATMQSNLGA